MRKGTYMGITPHDSLHIGSMRTFLYTYSFARKEGIPVYIRCDDTNPVNRNHTNINVLLSELQEFGVLFNYDELHYWNSSIIYQSQNTDIYHKYLLTLINLELTSEKQGLISLDISKVLRVIGDAYMHMDDLIKKTTHFNLSKSGYEYIPLFSVSENRFLFHIPCVIDEYLMGISVSIRGEDKISLVPIHDLLRRLLSLSPVRYLHLPILLDKITNKRLRGKEYSIGNFLKIYDKNVLLDYILKSGYRDTGSKFYSINEFIDNFDYRLIKKSSNYFDSNNIK